MANDVSVTAGSVTIFNQADGSTLEFFTDLVNGGGAQDEAVPAHTNNGWSGVFTSNEGGTLTRWDVQVGVAAGLGVGKKGATPSGDCQALIYGSGGGSSVLVTP